MDWRLIRTIIELKSGNDTESSIHQLCTQRAADLLRVQDRRCFVLICLIHVEKVTVALFDRGGSIISTPFAFTDSCGWGTFVRLILGLSYAPLSCLGLDPHVIGPPHSILTPSPTIKLDKVEIYFTPFITSTTHGRGTVVWLGWLNSRKVDQELQRYLGLEHVQGCPIIIKNNWVDISTTLTEGAILSILSAKGVQGVPRLLAEEAVKTDDAEFYLTTGYFRAKLGIRLVPSGNASRNTRSQAASHPDHTNGYEDRALLRTYSIPWATPLTQFGSALELLGAFHDCITSLYFIMSIASMTR